MTRELQWLFYAGVHSSNTQKMATSSDTTMNMEQQSSETTPPIPPTSAGIEPLALFGTETVDNLSNGFLAVLEPELVRVHKSLEELVINQDEMLDSVHTKCVQFEDTSKSTEIQNLLQRVPQCRHNITVLSKQMQSLNKRLKRLQQRAARLKELRIQRDVEKMREMERRLQQERMLEAKPSN